VTRTLAFALSTLALSAGAARAEPDVARFVVAVGFNEAPERDSLRYADDDAARVFELLGPGAEGAALHAAFDAESQALFAGMTAEARPPTLAALTATLAQMNARVAEARRAGRRTELFFFYAGHGDVDDGRGRVYLADGALDRAFLEQSLLDVPGRADRVHVAVDACKSYFLVAGRGPGGARRPVAGPFAGPVRRPGVGYLLSTSTDADAHEWGAIGGGVFSHLLRSAMLGAADIDTDGQVTYEEVGAFMGAATEGVTAGPFRPNVFVRAPPEDARASLLRLATVAFTPLRIESASAGRLTIVDQRGLRWAEAHKAGGAPLVMHLLSGRRYEVRMPPRRAEVEAAGAPVELAALPEAGATLVATRGEAHRALEGLYGAPFSPDVVRGYRLGNSDGARLAADAVVPEGRGVPPDETPWMNPTLLGVGAAGLVAGGVLAVFAADAHADAADAPQNRRADLTDRGNALTYGAGGAFAVGAAALGWAAARLWTAP
jgi:hypothetical protein